MGHFWIIQGLLSPGDRFCERGRALFPENSSLNTFECLQRNDWPEDLPSRDNLSGPSWLCYFRVMADQELRELLTEFQNLAESEHHSFISTIVNNFNYSNTIFAALVLFEVTLISPKTDPVSSTFSGSTEARRPFAAPLWPPLQCLQIRWREIEVGFCNT